MIRLSFIALMTFLALLISGCGSTPMPTTSAAATSTVATPTPTIPATPVQPTAAATAVATAALSPTPEPAPTVQATEAAHAHATIAAGAQVQVPIKLFTFKPATLDVLAGTTIEWTNQDAIEHSVTAGTPDKPGDVFDSDFFTQGGTFAFTFVEPGEYPYFCKRHESMIGKVNVTAP